MQPSFVSFESKEREEFLSQLGTFSPSERTVFHLLCHSWESRIPYDQFIAGLDTDNGSESDLAGLMHKLRAEHIGLIRTEIQDQQRRKSAIVLTDRDAPQFYLELLDEYFTDTITSITNPLPLKSVLNEELSVLPSGVFETVETSELARYFDREATTDRPLLIPSMDGDYLLINHKNLRAFVNITIYKLRHYLSNTALLEIAAKSLGSGLMQLKEQISTKEPTSWMALSNAIIEQRVAFEALRTVKVDAGMFHSAWLLKNLIESQIQSAKEQQKRESELGVDMEAIELAIKEAPNRWVEAVQVSRMLESLREKYDKDFETFRDSFYDKYVQTTGVRTLPKVVILDNRYIHRENIFPLFREHFAVVEKDVKLHFVDRMEHQLRTRNREKEPTFFSVDTFASAIEDYIGEHDPFLRALIQKPGVLVEGLILHAKQHKLAKDVDELKTRLALYFDPDTLHPLPIYRWFNLRMAEIFAEAFERLNILRRIWTRLTGKYEAMRSRFVGAGAADFVGAVPPGGQKATATRVGSPTDPDRSREQPVIPERSSPADARRSPRSTASARSVQRQPDGATKRDAQVKHSYSKKQVDDAWSEFGSTLKSKD